MGSKGKPTVSIVVALASALLGVCSIGLGVGLAQYHKSATLLQTLGLVIAPFVLGILFLAPLFIWWRSRNPVDQGQGALMNGESVQEGVVKGFGQTLNLKQVLVLVLILPLPSYLWVFYGDNQFVQKYVVGKYGMCLLAIYIVGRLYQRKIHSYVIGLRDR